jgi:hypothetical protein
MISPRRLLCLGRHHLCLLGRSKEPPVADARLRRDDRRSSWIRVDPLPELADEHPEHVDILRVSRSPHPLKQRPIGVEPP